jgi:hypothetical protein
MQCTDVCELGGFWAGLLVPFLLVIWRERKWRGHDREQQQEITHLRSLRPGPPVQELEPVDVEIIEEVPTKPERPRKMPPRR